MARLTGVLWIGTGAFFLGSSRIRLTLLGQCEMLLHTACHKRLCVMCIRFLLHDVHQFESSRLSDISNCLSCDYQHINNLMELMEG
jgi:hypothetical protein